ncbi:MAG: hypothetical protein U9Q40_00795 [Campylobacterota bacterium]|nr:hypothetical protein [Campylobacterota bacterium]
MNWLNFFQPKYDLKHTFGRGINANISEDEERLFTEAYEAFEKREILNAYELFFESLINFNGEEPNENITYKKDDEKLEFTIYQGSAKVTGTITNEHLYAQAIITKKRNADVALKRYILERNYQFTYSCYFSDDEYIMLKLYHDNITMSPQKAFYPLRELALNADFDKEHIKSEFSDVILEDMSHIQKMDESELKIKYDALHKWIDELENKVLTLPSNDNASMQAFLYLNLLFKVDYLLVPKCRFYQKMSKTILEYFSEESMSIESKNEELKRYVESLKEISFEDFSLNFYTAKYTFNPTEKTSHEEVINFISESLAKIRWYKNNRYTQVIPTIYRYIAFYALYNYGLYPVLRELLHTLVEIQNPEFFQALDYSVLYDKESQTFSKRTIISRVDDIIAPHQEQFKSLESFSDELNFSSMNEFSNSFYLSLQNLNFEEI